MNKEKDILEEMKSAKRPFGVPENYFSTVEDRVREKISAPQGRSMVWTVAKPALLLTCMFAVILGIGYGTMALTGTSFRGGNARFAEESAEESAEEVSGEIFSGMEDEELIEYLSGHLKASDLEMFVAELQTN